MSEQKLDVFDYIKTASRDAFLICANTAENAAKMADAGTLGPIDAASALRMVAQVFRSTAERT